MANSSNDRIQPGKDHPAYWQYKGKPVLLLGGSVTDHLFQIDNLAEHLDVLQAAGGNYVRNTMSGREPECVWPFREVDGRYDLNQWNDEYWRRFASLLDLTAERDIIIQIEVWATWDYYLDPWDRNPFNPKNNVNYTAEDAELPLLTEHPPICCENNFFWTVPDECNNEVVLEHQRRFVDKMLSYSLRYPNVLYCMNNETSVTPKWGWYWAEYIKNKAREAGTGVETTDMFEPHDLRHGMHNAIFGHPEIYSFLDLSQNNHKRGDAHWDNLQSRRRRLGDDVRPINTVKIYGGSREYFGSDRDGIERFWRNVFNGCAGVRFHRPPAGIGLSDAAQAHIRSMRALTDRMDVFTCRPHNDLLSDRAPNEAFCFAYPGREYAVYFPDGGEVTLDGAALAGGARLEWLDILKSDWREPEAVSGDRLKLSCPAKGHWAALVQAG